MFGIVNHIKRTEPDVHPSGNGSIPADQLAALEIYHRSKDKKDVIGAEFFNSEPCQWALNLKSISFQVETT